MSESGCIAKLKGRNAHVNRLEINQKMQHVPYHRCACKIERQGLGTEVLLRNHACLIVSGEIHGRVHMRCKFKKKNSRAAP